MKHGCRRSRTRPLCFMGSFRMAFKRYSSETLRQPTSTCGSTDKEEISILFSAEVRHQGMPVVSTLAVSPSVPAVPSNAALWQSWCTPTIFWPTGQKSSQWLEKLHSDWRSHSPLCGQSYRNGSRWRRTHWHWLWVQRLPIVSGCNCRQLHAIRLKNLTTHTTAWNCRAPTATAQWSHTEGSQACYHVQQSWHQLSEAYEALLVAINNGSLPQWESSVAKLILESPNFKFVNDYWWECSVLVPGLVQLGHPYSWVGKCA